MNTELTSQEYFQKNNYVVIRNFISTDIAMLLYHYCLIQTAAIDYKSFYEPSKYDINWDGQFGDEQAPGAYGKYGDPIMDSLLALSLNAIQQHSGLELNPNYTYWRLYQKGNDLKRHRDRPSCEISTTLCLGYNTSNVDQTMYPDYKWPIWVESLEETELGGIPINLNPGDLLIYRGCEVDHWRDEYIGLNHAQVFLHYNDKNGDINNVNDGRPALGLPKHTGDINIR
jgi:hypothetical protein